jgi:hypothetical protein
MTVLYYGTGTGRRRLIASAHEESLPHCADAPIYQAMIHQWSRAGKTLPGRRDPEWTRLTASTVRAGQFSAIPDPRGGGQ